MPFLGSSIVGKHNSHIMRTLSEPSREALMGRHHQSPAPTANHVLLEADPPASVKPYKMTVPA